MKSLIKNNENNFVYYEDSDELGYSEFLDMWNSSKKEICKFESLPFYATDEDIYKYYTSANYKSLVNDLVSYWNNEKNGLYKKVASKDLNFYRLHVIEKPINDYLISEYYSYIASEIIGEKIRVIEKNKISDLKYNLYDFILFDDFGCMITEYDDNFMPLGDWITHDKDIVMELRNLFNELYGKGQDFHTMYDGDKSIINDIIVGIKSNVSDKR